MGEPFCKHCGDTSKTTSHVAMMIWNRLIDYTIRQQFFHVSLHDSINLNLSHYGRSNEMDWPEVWDRMSCY
jgi:hypothetical protein